jgi:AraC-like DNA-binding protein
MNRRLKHTPANGKSGNVLAAAASGIRLQIERDGGDPEQALKKSAIDPHLLEDSRNPLDLRGYVQLMEIAAGLTGNDNFGLCYGQQFTPEKLGLIGMIAITSPNLGVALTNLTRLFAYHQQATETRLIADGEFIRLEYRILDGRIVDRRQDAELTMGMFANIFRHCAGPRWAPEEVHCEHPRPDMWREHERAFNSPVHFAQRTNAIIFNQRDLNTPMPNGDTHRLAALSEELICIAGGTGSIPLIDRVRSEIRRNLPDGGGTLDSVSYELRIARWTLQRCLAVEGCTFSDLVDQVRRDLAGRYLRQSSLSITEIAFMLGYSESSAFSRAFTRWWGVSPQGFRRSTKTL